MQDGRILALRFSAARNCFDPAASLVRHQGAVVSLVVGVVMLCFGSMDSTIRKPFGPIYLYTLLDMFSGNRSFCIYKFVNIICLSPIVSPYMHLVKQLIIFFCDVVVV